MKFKGINTKKLKLFRNFSLIFVPEDPGLQAKSRKMSFSAVFIIILSYSIISGFLGFLFFNVTPLKNLIFPVQEMNSSDYRIVRELNERMIYLNTELEKIKNTNIKMRKAVKLNDSSGIKPGGNIYTVILDFFDKIRSVQNLKITFTKPASGYISRSFMPEKGHMGVDYVMKTGTSIYSVAGGYVIFADFTTKDGFVIIVAHPDNYISFYKHCSSLIKKERDSVVQGELIALSGNSGEVTSGPHLHLEIWKNGKPIDPLSILINK